MMNLLALWLVAISLAAAGVLSPSPEKQGDQEVIVKNGHRTVVVEYEQDGHPNTKVFIAPDQQHIKGIGEHAKESIKEASSNLPNLGQGLSETSESGGGVSHASPKELICDAFGKCKHRIASAMGKAKEMVSETAHEAINETMEKVHEVGEAAGHAFGKAKEAVSKKAQEVEELAEESAKDAMGKVKEAKDIGKTIGEDIASNVSSKVEMAKEKVVEKAKDAKESVQQASDKLKQESKKELRGVFDVLKHLKYSLEAMSSLMGVFNLMGFATAYGMCMWVTFISSYVLAGAMPRQQFGIVQSKIYPVYFWAMACCIGVAFLGHLLGNRKRMFSSRAELFQGYNLLASLLMVLVNAIYLEPRATKVMFERMKMEKEEGRGREDLTAEPSRVSESQPVADAAPSTKTSTAPAAPSAAPERAEQEVIRSRIRKLNYRLKKLNSYSSFLNILTLMALNWHLVYLSQRLHLTC